MWVPLHLHSSIGSLLDGAQPPSKIAKLCTEQNYGACALTDHGTLFGAFEFQDVLQSKGIKPILGCELYLSKQYSKVRDQTNRKLSHLCVLAKNQKGWNNLIKIVSESNRPERYYYKPRLSLPELAELVKGDLVAFSGHPGSDLANICFTSLEAYGAETIEKASSYLNPNLEEIEKLALYYQEIFGKDNFFLEIQLIDQERMPACKLVASILRDLSKKTGIQCVGTADSHYTYKEDAHIQRILLCSALKTTLKTVYNKINNDEDVGLGGFFKSNNYHIPTNEEVELLYTEDELKNTVLISDMCESYSLRRPPAFPKLYDDDNAAIIEKCKAKCSSDSAYQARLDMELSVICKHNLSGYFLVLEELVGWANSQGILTGTARGSAGGCLISNLLGITKIDPVKHGLIFERFYNEGRNTKDRVSLPDIDVDFDRTRREDVIQHLRDKYGTEKVGHIVTLSSLQGRGAIKEVLRIYDACGQMEMNQLASHIPDESKISDKLEDMREQYGYSSILEWALDNKGKELSPWVTFENRELNGPFSRYFQLAMEIEGFKKNSSKHASGIVLANEDLSNLVPLYNQGGDLICGMEMGSLEQMGLLKLDILGLTTLTSINDTLKFRGITCTF